MGTTLVWGGSSCVAGTGQTPTAAQPPAASAAQSKRPAPASDLNGGVILAPSRRENGTGSRLYRDGGGLSSPARRGSAHAAATLFRPVAQRNEHRRRDAPLDRHEPDPAREAKTPRAGRAGVDQEGPAEPLDPRLVRVTEDAEVRLHAIEEGPALLRQLPALIQHVPDRDPQARQLQDRLDGQPALVV